MSINNIKEEKGNKIFKKLDILVYVILVIIIALLFILVFCLKDKTDISGFEISYKDNTVLTYSFSEDSFNYDVNSSLISIQKNETGYKICIYEGENTDSDYNVLQVDINNKKITMIDTDCSSSKDCTYMSIENMSDTIICVPHHLVITPIGKTEIKDPTIG